MASLGLLAAFLWLHSLDPAYFQQDDNYIQFAPQIIAAWRRLASEGSLLLWNPDLGLGLPVLELGTYSLTYPPTYLAAALADGVLGRPELFCSMFAAMHMVAGALLLCFWFQRKGMHPLLGSTAALSFVLCGYLLHAGRSWYYMLPLAFWLPALLILALEAGNMRRRDWVLLFGCAGGATFHSGNAQMWFYAFVLAVVLSVLVRLLARGAGKQESVSLAVDVVLAGCLTLAIAAPLLVPQLLAVSGLERAGGGNGVGANIKSIFFPAPVVRTLNPNEWEMARFIDSAGQVVYVGPLWLAALLGLPTLALLRAKNPFPANATKQAVIVALVALFCFDYSLGQAGLLWGLLVRLPVLSGFAHPFKVHLLTTALLIIGGAAAFDAMAKACSERWRRILIYGFCGLTLLMQAKMLLVAQHAFYVYDDRQYRPLPESIRASIDAQAGGAAPRIVSATPARSHSPLFSMSLPSNLPTLHGIEALQFYDPLVVNVGYLLQDEPVLAEFGVTSRLVFHESKDAPEKGSLEVQPIPKPRPRAYDALDSTPLKLDREGNSLLIQAAKGEGHSRVVVNYGFRKGWKASTDTGVPATLAWDWLGRLIVEIPQGAKWNSLRLDYRVPFGRGFLVSLVALVLAAGVLAFERRRGRSFARASAEASSNMDERADL